MIITKENKNGIKKIFKLYDIKCKNDLYDVIFDDNALLNQIVSEYPGIEYADEGSDTDKLWDIYSSIDEIEGEEALGKNLKCNFKIDF